MNGDGGELFDEVLHLEEQYQQEGRAAGISYASINAAFCTISLWAGREQGLREGRQLGVYKGFDIGEELGFYAGCITTWQRASQQVPPALDIPERVHRHLQQLQGLIDGFPLNNPQDERLQQLLEQVRGKFRAACAQLGLTDTYASLDATATLDLSF